MPPISLFGSPNRIVLTPSVPVSPLISGCGATEGDADVAAGGAIPGGQGLADLSGVVITTVVLPGDGAAVVKLFPAEAGTAGNQGVLGRQQPGQSLLKLRVGHKVAVIRSGDAGAFDCSLLPGIEREFWWSGVELFIHWLNSFSFRTLEGSR